MKKYLTFFLFCALLLPQISSAYNPETTHAGITEQIVEFYNLNNSHNKINSKDKEIIIQGAIDEDDPKVRALNHFYDPVRNMGINNSRTALIWATKPNHGNKFIWQENIDKYARGDREGALLGLGHILHLIEDMTVPDHTRNDPHIGDGPSGAFTGASNYEDWAKEHKDRQTLKGIAQNYFNLNYKINRLDSLEEYFDYLAIYSNNNYVSPDTIVNSVYQYANPVVIEKKNGYAYGEDSYFYDKHKLYIEDFSQKYGFRQIIVNKEKNDYSVLEEYFPRLVKMAILSGTGVAELFFSEAEQAREKYLEEERIKLEQIALYEAEKNKKTTEGNFFVKLWYKTNYAITDTVSAIVGTIFNTATTIGTSVYNGSSLVVNNTKNVINGGIYTGQELATIGIQQVDKIVTSVSEKVVLYIKENSTNLFTPAVAYVPPKPTLNQSQVHQLISILSTINNTNKINNINNEDNKEVKKVVHHSGSGSHRDPELVIVTIEPEATSTTATTTEDIATTTDEIATSTATTTEDIATSTATTTDPVIDITAPEVTFGPVLKCQDSLSDEICLLVATTSTIFDFSFLSTSTDISFYTISVDNGEEEDFVTATTSDNTMSIELTEDYEYIISLTATDLSGNISATTSAKIILSSWPISITEVFWFQVNGDDYAQEIVLRNETPYNINLDGMSLITTNNTASSTFDLDLIGIIPANTTFNLKKDVEGHSVEDIADQWYTGTFGRESEFLNLMSPSGLIFDFMLKLEEVFSC